MPRPLEKGSTYVPGLDGIRALAVIAVLGYHFGVPHLGGGLLGVSMFFTLSGFLITGILLDSWRATGGLDLARFYRHRARRLLPALGVLLVVVLMVTALVRPDVLAQRFGEAVSAALYVGNWTAIADGSSYFDYFAGPQPLEHLWSLAIEEQFYLVWPLVLLLLLRLGKGERRLALRVTTLLAAASFVWMALLATPGLDHTRVYEGTDTRAGELLVGAVLALLYSAERRVRPRAWWQRRGLDVSGLLALAVIGFLAVTTSAYRMTMYHGGLLVLAVATAVLVAVVSTPGTAVGWLLGRQPLRWVGERSYGIYLWHMPVVALTPQSLVRGFSVPLAVFHAVLTLLLAALSWSLVEDPIRRHGFRGALRSAVPHRLVGGRMVRPVLLGLSLVLLASVATLTASSQLTPKATLSAAPGLGDAAPPAAAGPERHSIAARLVVPLRPAARAGTPAPVTGPPPGNLPPRDAADVLQGRRARGRLDVGGSREQGLPAAGAVPDRRAVP